MRTTVDIRYNIGEVRATIVFNESGLTADKLQQLSQTLDVFRARDVIVHEKFFDGDDFDSTLRLIRRSVRSCVNAVAAVISIDYMYGSRLGTTWMRRPLEQDVEMIKDELTTVITAFLHKD